MEGGLLKAMVGDEEAQPCEGLFQTAGATIVKGKAQEKIRANKMLGEAPVDGAVRLG